MSAERGHLRLVTDEAAAPDPADADVWRRGLAACRAELTPGRHQPEGPGAEPEAPAAGVIRPRLPAVEAACSVLEDGHEEGQR